MGAFCCIETRGVNNSHSCVLCIQAAQIDISSGVRYISPDPLLGLKNSYGGVFSWRDIQSSFEQQHRNEFRPWRGMHLCEGQRVLKT